MSRFLAKWGYDPPATVRKAIGPDTSKLTFSSLLTYPCVDLAGDYVRGDGCDFAPHQADPCVDLEHRRHPVVKGMPVAWARESLDEPGAPYSVRMVALDFDDLGTHTVPVGTEFYDKSCPVSMQVFALREQGALPASSLEFAMVPGFYKAIGHSELENRPAYQFDRVSVHRWTVCARGVNPGALLVEKSASAPRQVPSPLSKILADRRVNVGGRYEPLHGMILKALGGTIPHTKPHTVRVEKAMDEYDDMPEDGGDDMLDTTGDEIMDDAPDAQEDSGPTPTAQAAYNLSQGAKDLRTQVEADLKRGEHKPGRKKLTALLEKLDAISEMAMSVGKQVDADTGGDDMGADEPAGEGDEPEPEAEATPEDMEEDDDGVLKGIPPTFKKSVKRFKLADIHAAPSVQKAPDVERASASPELSAAYADFLKWKKHAGV